VIPSLTPATQPRPHPVVTPRRRPSGLITLIYLAAVLLPVGVVTLGIGLFQACAILLLPDPWL
jgi:hypothetical protein